MLASELLKAVVVDAGGRRLGHVQDLGVVRDGDGFRAVSLVLGEGRLAAVAHTWGYVESARRGRGSCAGCSSRP